MLDTEFRSFLVTLIVDVAVFGTCCFVFAGSRAPKFCGPISESITPRSSRDRTPLLGAVPNTTRSELDSSDLRLYLAFLQIMAVLFGAMTICGLLIIVPIRETSTWLLPASLFGKVLNGYGHMAESLRLDAPENGTVVRLYVLFAMVLLFSVFCAIASRYFHNAISACEENTLPSETERVAHHCVMIKNLHRRRTNSKALLEVLFGKEDEFESGALNMPGPQSTRYRSQLVQTSIVYNFQAFYDAQTLMQSASEQVERYQLTEEQTQQKALVRGYGIVGPHQAAVDHYGEELVYRKKVLGRLLKQGLGLECELSQGKGLECAGVAFLVFTTPETQHDVLRDPNVQSRAAAHDLVLQPAPPPGDVAWKNLHVPPHHQRLRVVAFTVLLFMLCWLMVCPLSLWDRLHFLFVHELNEDHLLRVLITGYLPPLVILGINSLVIPQCIWYAAKWERWWRKSERQRMVLHMNLFFMVINSMIIPLTCFHSLQTLVEYLATTPPTEWNVALGGTFFFSSSASLALRYMVNSTFLSSAAQLLQIPQLLTTKILLALAVTERDRMMAFCKWPFDFGFWYACCLAAFFICLVFSIVAPLILPCGTAFFIVKYYIDSYNFTRGVVSVNMESQGALARAVESYMWLGLAFYHFCMSGFFIVQGFKTLGAILFTTSIAITLFAFTPSTFGKSGPLPKKQVKDLTLLEQAYLHPWERARRDGVA